MKAIFLKLCPNCGGDISDYRLSLKVPCEKCLPLSDEKILEIVSDKKNVQLYILELLKNSDSLKNLRSLYEIEIQLEELNNLFHRATGSRLWSAQRTWAKRIFSGKNFAIIAPTGMGKSVFGIILSLYYALKNRKCYIIVPTAILAEQTYQRMIIFLEKIGTQIKISRYHSMLSEKERELEKETIISRQYHILVTTSAFLSKNFEMINGDVFDLIVVDDVDALLKSSKNVDKVLCLAGFSEEIIAQGLRLIELRRKYQKNLRKGENVTELIDEIWNIRKRIENYMNTKKIGNIIVSGASPRAKRTKRIKLFKELMGFEIGSRIEFIRNIEDLFIQKVDNIEEKVVQLVKILGSGGIIFVPMDKGLEFAEKLYKKLSKEKISVSLYDRTKAKILEDFSSGKIELLIGIASYRSPLARGIDLPHIIRYAIFAGVPKFKISLDMEKDFTPTRAIILLSNLKELVREEEQAIIEKYVTELRSIVQQIPSSDIKEILDSIYNNLKLEGYKGIIKEKLEKIREFLIKLLSMEEIIEKIRSSPNITISSERDRPFLVIPDTIGYIQASGRTSRMFVGGISKGISVTIVDDEKAFNGLVRESRLFSEEIEWKNFDEVNLNQILEEVDRDRATIKMLMAGTISPQFKDPITTALLVVESPNKVKTIARFFGKPSKRTVNGLTVYEVSTGDYILNITASGGHLFDLPTHLEKNSIHGVIRLDDKFVPVYITIKICRKCKKTFAKPLEKCPYCQTEVIDKANTIEALRKLALETDQVLIGTDADAEGEKIGWDISTALSPYTPKIKRIEFHEITKRALVNGLRNMRDMDMKLVEAQMVRRVEDRWLGFELSAKLWDRFNDKTLSAGRVQTPVLGWIINRTNESRKSFQTFFEIILKNGLKFIIKIPIVEDSVVREEIDKLLKTKYYIKCLSKEEIEIHPLPPYSTDTLLQEAAITLKFTVQKTMNIAQDLFELGLITYHRTDSIRVSPTGQNVAKEYIIDKFNKTFFKPREWSKEGAHECIRPTRPIDAVRLKHMLTLGSIKLAKKITQEHFQLYEQIFRRFIASQMKQAKVLKERYEIRFNNNIEFIEGYTKIIEEGFNLIQKINLIPELQGGEVRAINVKSWKAPTIPLLKQADVIKLMKLKDIGRPSTYAKIVTTLFQRGYVQENDRKDIIPTKKGYQVYFYLNKRFYEFISEETTQRLKKTMDSIEEGKVDYQQILNNLYKEILTIRGQ
ncbi:MAG: reverse gyrase [Nitrososphaeria archaeon]|nr:reverse gyrase [Nitrososphaeria archaeon]